MADAPLPTKGLMFYLRVALVGSMDLVVGTLIAYLIGGLFKNPNLVGSMEEYDLEKWLLMGADLAFQGLLTLFIAVEFKNIFFEWEDPTGGILFILSVFRQQSFWAKVDVLALAVYNLVMGDIYPSMFTPT